MKPIELRPYQRTIVDDTFKLIDGGENRICLVLPCGAGKTVVAGWLVREYYRQGKRVIFFVHRQELIEQTERTFDAFNIPHGIDSPIQISSVQTLSRKISTLAPPDLLICDECHHIMAESYKKIVEHCRSSVLIGLTATPERYGGVRLGDIFKRMLIGPTVGDLIDSGHLAPLAYCEGQPLDVSNIRTIGGDYDTSALEVLMTKRTVVASYVESYLKHAADKPALCYCVTREHSKKVTRLFNAAGIPAAHCDGETPKAERKRIVEDFRTGKIRVLCNVDLFGEGFDVPNVHAVILARPTKSLTLHLQQAMRAMRPDPSNPDKRAVIIDLARNCDRHGYPTAPHKWSLEPNPAPGIPPECETENKPPTKDFIEISGAAIQTLSIDAEKPILRKFHSFFATAQWKGYKKPLAWAFFQSLSFAHSKGEVYELSRACEYGYRWSLDRWYENQRRRGIGG